MAMKKGLGRGLDDLFGQNTADENNGAIMLKISEIEPNRMQPRQAFDDASIAELAESISQHGVIQPLIVRPQIGGTYQIVAGERRWRASRMAGLTEVPVIIRELSDIETAQIALIENLQREDLNPIDEARGYKMLMETYEMTQDDIAKSVGKSRPVVANSLRLLNLPEDIMEKVSSRKLSSAQARTLLSFKNDELMRRAAQLAETGSVTVRDMEKMASKSSYTGIEKKPDSKKNSGQNVSTHPFFKEVELGMSEFLSRRVKVKSDSQGGGTLEIQFYSAEDLQQLLQYFES